MALRYCGTIAFLVAVQLLTPALSLHAAAPPGGTLAERYQRAQKTLQEQRENEDKTRTERDRLAAEARTLQDQLIANAAKVQELEAQSETTAAELARLNQTIREIESDLLKNRDRVAGLLAILQRLDADTPPALALKPEDSLSAARGAMQMGAMLPPVYRQARDLSQQLKTLSQTRLALAKTGEEARLQAASLSAARASLDGLLQKREAEHAAAESKLSDIHALTEEIGRQASNLKALIDRIANLRASGPDPGSMTIVTAPKAGAATLTRGSLRRPVVGTAIPGDSAGPGRTPGESGPLGLWFESTGRAETVAPADSEVVFAGNYQKFGLVLILELPGGYHLTLAGLGRIDVRIGDLVLAGEPVGVLPEGNAARLYMELRRNGQAVDPAPWLSVELRKAKGT